MKKRKYQKGRFIPPVNDRVVSDNSEVVPQEFLNTPVTKPRTRYQPYINPNPSDGTATQQPFVQTPEELVQYKELERQKELAKLQQVMAQARGQQSTIGAAPFRDQVQQQQIDRTNNEARKAFVDQSSGNYSLGEDGSIQANPNRQSFNQGMEKLAESPVGKSFEALGYIGGLGESFQMGRSLANLARVGALKATGKDVLGSGINAIANNPTLKQIGAGLDDAASWSNVANLDPIGAMSDAAAAKYLNPNIHVGWNWNGSKYTPDITGNKKDIAYSLANKAYDGSGLDNELSLKNSALNPLIPQPSFSFNPYSSKKQKEGIEWLKKWYSDPEIIARIKDHKEFDKVGARDIFNNYSDQIYGRKRFSPEDINRLTHPKNDYFFKSHSKWDEVHDGKVVRGDMQIGKFAPKRNVAIHEGTHQITHNGGFFNEETRKLLQQGFKTDPDEVIPDWEGKRDLSYYANPTEIHARINEIRSDMGVKPSDVITQEMLDKVSKGPTAGWELKPYIKNKALFLETLNKMYVGAPIVAGAAYQGLNEQDSPLMQQGGSIPINPNGLWEENGPVIIPSNQITMKNRRGKRKLPQRVMAYPDGDSPVMMENGEEYYFPNSSQVLEVPLLQEGGTVNDFNQRWLTSPMHNKMLTKSAGPIAGPIIAATRQGVLNETEEEIVDNIATLPLGKVLGKSEARFSEPENPRLREMASVILPDFLIPSQAPAPEIQYLKGMTPEKASYVATHERSHASDYNGYLIPKSDVEKINKFAGNTATDMEFYKDAAEVNAANGLTTLAPDKKLQDIYNYVKDPTETRARLNTTREWASKNGIYDPFTQKLDRKKLNLIKDQGLDELRMVYSDDEIFEMLNSISSNQSTTPAIPLARRGGIINASELNGYFRKKNKG